MIAIGVMQGRLSPQVGDRIQIFPRDSWEAEFPRARDAGFDGIEWIYEDLEGFDNPLVTPGGVARIRALSRSSGVAVKTVCADEFMPRPFFGVGVDARERALEKVKRLLGACSELGVESVVFPFVDHSSLAMSKNQNEAMEVLEQIGEWFKPTGIRIALETDLGPADFGKFLAPLPSSVFGVNYDIGNSAGMGFDPREEFASYGDRITHVHLKDRVKGGTTVVPGTGSAEIEFVLSLLKHQKFNGPFTFQIARGPGDETEVEYLRGQLARWAPSIRGLDS